MDVEGGARDFRARVACAEPEEVWRRWTTPSTWGAWDRGLAAAELVGPFEAGATGVVVGLDGRRSPFVVDAVEPMHRVRWHVRLPGGRMELERTLAGGYAEHRVRFRGPLAGVWAAVLGRSFRPLLPPTMKALVASPAADS